MDNEDNKFALAIRTPETLALASELEAAKKNAAAAKSGSLPKCLLYGIGFSFGGVICMAGGEIATAMMASSATMAATPVAPLIAAAISLGGYFPARLSFKATLRREDKIRATDLAVRQLKQSLETASHQARKAAIQTLRQNAAAILDKTFAARQPLANTEIALAVDGGSDKILRVDAVEPITHMEKGEPLPNKAWELTVTLYELAGQTAQGLSLKGDPVAILPSFKHVIAKTENTGPR